MARWPPLPDERGATGWGFGFRFISSKLPYLHFDTFCTYFLLFVLILEISLDLCHSFFMIVFLNCFADHHVFIPNFSLVNKQSLDKILQAEVFVHKDG